MAYHAIIEVNGKSALVLPRSKKRMAFDTIEAAEKALEQRGKRITARGAQVRGIVKLDGQPVLYLAL